MEEKTQAIIMVVLVAGAGLALWSSQQNQVTTFGGLKGQVDDADYMILLQRYEVLEKQVQGKLSGLGLPGQLNWEIKEWRREARDYRATVDELTQGDVAATLDQYLLVSGRWLDTDANLHSGRAGLIRNMKAAPRSGNAVRNPLRKPITTGNESFNTPLFNSSALVASRTPAMQQVSQMQGIEMGNYYGDSTSAQPGQMKFLQGNAVNDGKDVLMLGSSQKLNFDSDAFTTMQVSNRPNALADIAEMEVEHGMISPPQGVSRSHRALPRGLPRGLPQAQMEVSGPDLVLVWPTVYRRGRATKTLKSADNVRNLLLNRK